ncbi:hypothetical protein M8C21_018040, partial [Ambrosia artemisiifolia]
MSSSSSCRMRSSSNLKIVKVGTDGKLYCEHNLLAVMRQGGTCASRPGHYFYESPFALRRADCKLFMWKEDVDNLMLSGPEKRALQIQNERLEVEKDLLQREVASLKTKVDAYE